MSSNLAASLLKQGKHAETAGIQRKVLVSTTRLLGAEHENTLISMANLACTLFLCGQNAEGKQILLETMALSRRAIGPAHEQTQLVLRGMCALGLAAR